MRSGGLQAADWAVITEYQRCLHPLKIATKRLDVRSKHYSSNFGAIHEVLPVFEYLLDQLEKLAEPYADVDFDVHEEALEGKYYTYLCMFLAKYCLHRSPSYQPPSCLE